MTGSILVHLETASRNSRRWVKLQTGIEQAILPQLFQCNIKPIMDNLSYCIETIDVFMPGQVYVLYKFTVKNAFKIEVFNT